MKKQFYTLAALLFMGIAANAQVGIGTTTPATSSMLDVASTTKGFLMPRMTTANRTAIASPAAGLQVYDTTTNSIWFFDGSVWKNGGLNIYNSNGSLTGDRTIGYGGKNLTFSGGSGSTFFTSNNALPMQITGPLSTTANSMLRIGGASGTAAVGQQALIGFNPNFINGSYPIAIGAEYVNGSANEGAADFVVKTSGGGGATTRFLVQNAGNVGIGTTTPGAKLDVNGTIKITDGSQAAGKVLTSDANGLASWQTVAAGSTGDGSETKVQAGTNTTVTGSGTTAAPYVVDASNLYTSNGTLTSGRSVNMNDKNLQFNSTTGTFVINTATGTQAFTQTGAGIFGIDAPNVSNGRFVVLENGNVGIGQRNPNARLDVAGTVKIADGTQGAGKVLTSDANGLATWATAASTADGSETKVQAGTNTTVTGSGTTASPYIVNATAAAADGSETKVTAGTNVTITGSGTTAAPYVVNSTGGVLTNAGVYATAVAYTLQASDLGKIITSTNASGTISITVPATLPAGFYCEIIQKGAGRVNVVAGSGTVVNYPSGGGSLARVKNSAIGVIVDTPGNAYVTGDCAL